MDAQSAGPRIDVDIRRNGLTWSWMVTVDGQLQTRYSLSPDGDSCTVASQGTTLTLAGARRKARRWADRIARRRQQ